MGGTESGAGDAFKFLLRLHPKKVESARLRKTALPHPKKNLKNRKIWIWYEALREKHQTFLFVRQMANRYLGHPLLDSIFLWS